MAAGGFKMSLGGLKAKPGLRNALAPAAKPKKALLGDDEPDDTPKTQEIAGFDAAAGGAIDVNGPAEKKGPLVIPSLPNRNWREEARKRQGKAPHTKQQGNGEDVVMEEPEKEVVFGLTVPTKPAEASTQEDSADTEAMDVDSNGEPLSDAQRLEKQALEHLLNGKSTDIQRVVPAITDEEALANDLVDAPDEPDLDAYEATPIEGFGLAMLRGMGWKDSDGESRSKNGAKAPKEVKRRPALLGIGAKEDAAKDVELGEFNSKARPKKGQKSADKPAYTPVTLRNKKTGETITEEELKQKLESQDIVGDEAPREREREKKEKDSRRRDDRDKDRRRDDRDEDRRRDDYDSERRRERDRRRDKYDKYDDERSRDKRRDREYDTDRSSKRRDRSRSPRESRRDRDRYRSRSRDKGRRRSRSRSPDEERRRRKDGERERRREGDERERERRR